MTATVRNDGPFEKIISFTISEAEIEAGKNKTARRLSKGLKIKGFRPGKAPRPIVEATVGADYLRSETIDDLLPEKAGEILDGSDLEPAITPVLEGVEEAEDGVTVEVRVTLWPKLDNVPEHHDRKIEVGSVEVTDEELDDQIGRIRGQFAQVDDVERPAAEGDYVMLDLSATADGEPVEEANASQIMYEVGHGGFIEGADDVLVGLSVGESTTFDGELPPGFGELAGKPVTYSVTVTAVKEKQLPDLTDEWVAEVTEFETVAEMQAELKVQMGNIKKQSLARSFQDRALSELVDLVEIELPDNLVRSEIDDIFHRFSHRMEEQGLTLQDYFQVTGVNQQMFLEDLRNQADRSIRTRLLLEGVIDHEGLEVGDDELSSYVEVLAMQSDDAAGVRRMLAEGPARDRLVGDILRNKALEAIVAAAVAVDEAGEVVDLTIESPPEPELSEAAEDIVEAEVVEAEVVAEVIEAGTEEE